MCVSRNGLFVVFPSPAGGALPAALPHKTPSNVRNATARPGMSGKGEGGGDPASRWLPKPAGELGEEGVRGGGRANATGPWDGRRLKREVKRELRTYSTANQEVSRAGSPRRAGWTPHKVRKRRRVEEAPRSKQ